MCVWVCVFIYYFFKSLGYNNSNKSIYYSVVRSVSFLIFVVSCLLLDQYLNKTICADPAMSGYTIIWVFVLFCYTFYNVTIFIKRGK
jgi:hypothetical protein